MSDDSGVLSFARDGAVAAVLIDSPPVNALGHAVRLAIRDGLGRLLADDAVESVVLACKGRTFFAGADVTEIGRPMAPPLLGDIMAATEASPKPIVAALHGTALGGGLELALACHYRVAVSSAKVGLPEVALGLLPGAGGTQRVPRLVGVAAAVEMIGLGRHVTAPEALQMGLIDAVIDDGDLLAGAFAYARLVVEQQAPLRRARDRTVDLDLAEAREVFAGFRAAHPELFVGLKAADGVLEAIEAAVTLPFEDGLNREREISRRLVASPESAAQRHLFFAERAAAKIPGAEKMKGRPVASLMVMGGKVDLPDVIAGAAATGAQIVHDPADTDLVVAIGEFREFEDLANGSRFPTKVIGLRATGGLVEVVSSRSTDPQTIMDAMALARRTGRAAVHVRASQDLVVGRITKAAERSAEALAGEGVSLEALAAVMPGLLGAGSAAATDAGLEQRLLDPVAAEAFGILEEGLVARASDIDFAMVRAGRWPVWRGGPVFWAERQGLVQLCHRLGDKAPARLRRLVETGRSAYDA